MNSAFTARAFVLALATAVGGLALLPRPEGPDPAPLVRDAVAALLRLETAGGWPYEGVYRTGGAIPLPYRVGGTALAGLALLAAAPADRAAREASDRAARLVLGWIDAPEMLESLRDAYDVRVWGQACALEFLCARPEGPDDAIRRLTRRLLAEELPEGGWNYATRRQTASFVTPPVVRALLAARSRGAELPGAVLARARDSLERARAPSGATLYMGRFAAAGERTVPDGDAGSAGRAPAVAAVLERLDARAERGAALELFHRHWEALEARRGRTGTHEGPHLIAPYYFCWAHRAAGWAGRSAADRARLLERIRATREPEGTWNDRVFPASRGPCTAIMLLAVLGR